MRHRLLPIVSCFCRPKNPFVLQPNCRSFLLYLFTHSTSAVVVSDYKRNRFPVSGREEVRRVGVGCDKTGRRFNGNWKRTITGSSGCKWGRCFFAFSSFSTFGNDFVINNVRLLLLAVLLLRSIVVSCAPVCSSAPIPRTFSSNNHISQQWFISVTSDFPGHRSTHDDGNFHINSLLHSLRVFHG